MSDLVTWLTSISRTFGESWVGQRARGYWKQFGELVIGSAHKYRDDPFFRTEVTIIVLQGAFAVFLLLVVGVIATQLYHDASVAVAQGINTAVTPHTTPAIIGDSVIADLSAMRSRTVLIAAGAVLMVTTIFTYIIARVALSPTRNALESQKQFIGNVAHELRTPLSIIKANTEIRLMEGSTPSDARLLHEDNLHELDRISEILNNLLSLSASIRPERIEFGDVDLGEVVTNVMRKLRDLAESKQLELEVRVSERSVVRGNVVALEQIVMNIIKNAISYTGKSGRILVTVEPVHPDLIELTVRDSGRGIARRDLFRIFEPYFRADPSRKRGEGSSGLGLTIVSELVKLHNGKITVRSAEGRGTTVTVLLPTGKTALGADKAIDREHDAASEVAVDFSNGTRSS